MLVAEAVAVEAILCMGTNGRELNSECLVLTSSKYCGATDRLFSAVCPDLCTGRGGNYSIICLTYCRVLRWLTLYWFEARQKHQCFGTSGCGES